MHEKREASAVPEPEFDTGRTVKAISPKTVVHAVEDSDWDSTDEPAKQSRSATDHGGRGGKTRG